MKNLDKILFKKTKPVIREMESVDSPGMGDVAYLWDAYRKGLFPELPQDLDMDQWVDACRGMELMAQEIYIVEDFVSDELVPVAAIFCRNDGFQLEPYLIYFDNATPRIKLRASVGFLKHTKYRKDIGSCLVRTDKCATRLANRLEQMKLLEYVGKIWGGRPDGNEYLYSLRCARKA